MRRAWRTAFRRTLSTSLVVALLVAVPVSPSFGRTAAAGTGTDEAEVRPYSWSAANVRVAGADRLQTAVAVSEQGWDSSDYVVIATSRKFPDALAGGPLAYLYDAPLLTTEPDHLPQVVAEEISRLGATTAFVLGGAEAVSLEVDADLYDAGIKNVERIGGADRYETAGLVAEHFAEKNGGAEGVIVATGQDFPDALAVSGFAGWFGTPILLTAPGRLPAGTLSALGSLAPNSALIVGGEKAVSATVEAALPNPVRIGGTNRYDTARLIAEFAFSNGFTYESVFVATGLDFPDALAVGPLAAKMKAPVVLTAPDSLPVATDEFFNDHCSSVETVFVLGGSAAVSEDVLSTIDEATTTQLNENLEVVSDEMASQLTSVSPEGTMTFPADTPGLESIDTSSVLVAGPSAAAPYGYLVRVTGKNVTPSAVGDMVSLETTMASLDEVILKGSIDITSSPDPMFGAPDEGTFALDSATSLDDSHVELSLAERSSPTSGAVAPALDIGGQFNLPFEVSVTTPRSDSGHAGTIAVAGNVFARGSFVFNISFGTVGYHWEQEWYFNWGWKTRWVQKPTYGIRTFETKVYFGVGLELRLKGAAVDYEFDVVEFLKENYKQETRKVLTQQWIWVGWVPVHMALGAQPIITVGASCSLEVETGFKLEFGATVGVAYDYRTGWRNLSGISPRAEWIPWSPTGAATMGFSLGVKFDVKFYGLIGPYIGVQGTMELGAKTNPAPTERWWEAAFKVEGVAGGEFEIFSKKWSIGAKFELLKWRIAAAPAGPFLTPGVDWWPAAMPDSGTTPAGCLPVFWDTSPAGTVGAAAIPQVAPPLSVDPSTVDATDFAINGLDILAADVLSGGDRIVLTTSKTMPGEAYVVASPSGKFFDMTNRPNMLGTASFTGYYEPSLAGASVADSATVEVLFDNGYGALDPNSMQPSDFNVPGLTVLEATPGFNGSGVVLTTTPMSRGQAYNVSVAKGAVTSREGFPCTAGAAGFIGYYEPAVASAAAVASDSLAVAFDVAGRSLDSATVGAADFSIPGLTVTDAVVQPDGATVVLTTSEQQRGTDYSVEVASGDVLSADGYPASAASASFVGYWPVQLDYGYDVNSTTVDVVMDSMNPIDPASVSATDFTITDRLTSTPLSVVAAALQPDGVTVRLSTDPSVPGLAYDVHVVPGSITDGTFVSVAGPVTFTGTSVYITGSGNIPATDSLVAMGSTSSDVAYATGMAGKTYRTTNGGATWQPVATAQPGAVGNSYDIAFPDPTDSSTLVVVGFGGSISRSTDSANTFVRFYNANVTTNHNGGVDFAGSTGRGYVVHGAGGLIESTDGGVTWHRHPTQDLEVKGGEVAFADDIHGYVGASAGTVWVTEDSGATWTATSTGLSGALVRIAISPDDPAVAVAVSSVGEIARTEDFGNTWSPSVSGTTLALSEVQFADGNVVFAGGAQGIVLVSRDAGRTWMTARSANAGQYDVGAMWVRDANSVFFGGLAGANNLMTGF